MVELAGILLILFSAAVLFNPGNPVPDDLENLKIIKEKMQNSRLWGHKEDS